FYRLQIAFEDVWAELIDESVGITAQAFYARWDALMNEGMRSDFNDEQLYTGLLNVSLPTLINNAKWWMQNRPDDAMEALSTSIEVVAAMQKQASAEFKSAFGLDLQNIQAEIETARLKLEPYSGLNVSEADSKPITDPLDAALQIIVTLQGKLLGGAAARKASFDHILDNDISRYDQLENFLNDVRVVLGLPVVIVPKTDSSTTNLSNGTKDAVAALGKLIDTLSLQNEEFVDNYAHEYNSGANWVPTIRD